MENGDPLPYLLDLLSFRRLIAASFLLMLRFAHLLTVVASEFSESVPPLEQQMSRSDSSCSHGFYNIYLGLYPYVQNGARSGLGIEVDSHEGAVHFSTLRAIYWDHYYSLLSVWWAPHFLTLNHFCPRPNGGEFDEDCVLEFSLLQWRFVSLIHWSGREFIFRSVMSGLGVVASESNQLSFPFSELYWPATDSDPHITDMGRVESEPAFVHYSSNFFRPCRGFEPRHCGDIS